MKKIPLFKVRLKGTFMRYAVALVLLPFVAFIIFTLLITSVSRLNTCQTVADMIEHEIAAFYTEQLEFVQEVQHLESLQPLLLGGKETFNLNRDIGGFLRGGEYRRAFFLLNARGDEVYSNLRDQEKASLLFIKQRLLLSILDSNASHADMYTFYNSSADNSVNIIAGAVLQDGEIKGYLGLILDNAALQRMLNRHKLDMAIVTDRYDNIVSYLGVQPVKNFMGKLEWNPRPDTYTTQRRALPGGLTLVVAIERQTDWFLLRTFSMVFVFLLMALLLMLHLLSNNLSRKLSRETEALVAAVERLGAGDLDYTVPLGDDYEFAAIANHLNQMTASLKDLNARNSELADLNRKVEVKQLEMQFNPHFIYNVLETVKVMAYLDPTKADQIIQRLSRLLRFSVNQTHSMVTIQEDLEYIEDYLFIQKCRFEDAFQYELRVETGILDCLIPKLIVQSLVENSIKHGFLGQKALRVVIKGRLEGRDIVVSVMDNGVPMEPEIRQKVRATLMNETPPEAHIGVFNINRRLVLLYGGAYGLRMTEETAGNEFVVRIPARRKWNGGDADA